MSERDSLYNALLDVIKSKNVPVGLAKAVLEEVSCEISRAANNLQTIDIAPALRKREPRE